MVRLGYHRSLVGGIAAPPTLPQTALARELLHTYSSHEAQVYPLNVRAPFVPNLNSAEIEIDTTSDLPFSARHNLYQRVKKCIRLKQDTHSLSWTNLDM